MMTDTYSAADQTDDDSWWVGDQTDHITAVREVRVDRLRGHSAVIRQFSICAVRYFSWPVPGESKQRWLEESEAL